MKAYPSPLLCVRSIRREIFRSVFSKMGAPVVSSNPSSASGSLHSGKTVEISSSKLKSPFSTHCSAAIAVMSFVHDATHMQVSVEKGSSKHGELGSRDFVPNDL